MQGPLLLLLALAAAPEILVPPWPLSADGELVGVRAGALLAAEGARVEPVSAGLFRVVPAAGVTRVLLSAGAASVSAQVEPPPGEIAISLLGPPPVKGRDAGVELELALPDGDEDGAAAAPRPPEIVASTGKVRDLRPAGPGRFRAFYEPAETRHPEVLVLVALAPRCPLCTSPRAVGHAIVPLVAAIELPGQSEPGVRTTVTIAGRRFGPAVAGRGGRFSLPVVVPPGAHLAVADSVDALGNHRRRELDLRLPRVDRLACAAWPRALPADGRSAASLWCVASTDAGDPAPGARIALAADRGETSPAAPFRGALQRATFRAPAGGGGARAIVRATYLDAGAASSDELRLELAPLAPAEIVAVVPGEPVPLGAEVIAETAVRDAQGTVIGRPSGPEGARLGFVSPDRFVARREAGDYAQDAPLSLALPPGGDVARLALRRAGAEWLAEARTVDARPAAGVPLRFGSGAVAVTDARGEARARAASPQETVHAANGARAAGWTGIVPPPSPIELARIVRVALRPPTPVDVVARVEDGFLRWRVEQGGRALPARAVTLRASAVVLGSPEPDGEGGRAALRSGRGAVAVVDDATGVAAVVEVP